MWWVITWPIFLAVWAFLFGLFARCYFGGRLAVSAKRSLRWVCYLSVGYCGLIVIVSVPAWLDWVHLYCRGVPVRAKVVSWNQEYDPERTGGHHFTHVTYQFEAEVAGQRQQFRREGELPGQYFMVSGFINVLYDPADPAHSRMTRESRGARDGVVAAAVFLALGVASFLLSRGPRRAQPTPSASEAVA